MKGCDLCGSRAMMHCESDKASLCWGCDAEVHCANFLVARHSRSLLCHACQAPTPWKASGPKLVPTASFCLRCAVRGCADSKSRYGEEKIEGSGNNGLKINAEDKSSDGDDDDCEDEVENQVVPWSGAWPPPSLCSSSSEVSSSKKLSNGNRAEPGPRYPPKRSRRSDSNLEFQDALDGPADGEASSPVGSLSRPLKERRTTEQDRPVGHLACSRSITIFGTKFPVYELCDDS